VINKVRRPEAPLLDPEDLAPLPRARYCGAMSEENVELVRRGHEAFRDSGEEAIFE
jgi:hypothetical protein